ncbi:MAG: DUF1294 domain-containing protein [Clostridia bacterium]|nr:DUF1294 domain-containing protein [Clostridia bacterium]MBP3292873.1 DUF1294 domain-containing protein [Clostridia bacterium]
MNGMELKLTGILLAVFGLISIAAMILTIVDKVRAKNHEWRVPENTLLLVAAFGGAAAMLVTMLIIRHKTQHRKFMGGLPILLFFQIVLVLWCNFRFGLF